MTATIAMFIDPISWLMVFIMVGVPAIAVYLGVRASKRHSVAKAGWYLDPTARHAYRFWDGKALDLACCRRRTGRR